MLRGARVRPDRRRLLNDSYAAERAAPRRREWDDRMKIARRSGACDGKREANRRPLPLGAVDRQLTAVRDHQMLDDREAEPGAAQLARARLVHAIETLGDARQVCGWNTDARVGDGDTDPAAHRPRRADGDAATRRRVL